MAIAECVAVGVEGLRGIVADSKAYSRRTLGVCLEQGIFLPHLSSSKEWLVLATTVDAAVCPDSEIRHAYQEQNTPVEPGWRWIKNPAAMALVWLEKPEWIAA